MVLLMWWYRGEEFIDGTAWFGFVYLITNTTNNRQYIGRKLFTRPKQKKASHTRQRRERVENDWKSYYGSSEELLQDIAQLGKEHFHREILRLCRKRGEVNFFETYEILTRNALFGDAYYNKWCSLRIHKKALRHLDIPLFLEHKTISGGTNGNQPALRRKCKRSN